MSEVETYDELRKRMVGMLDRYAVFWEVCDQTYSAWPGDPDGGELRLVGALKQVIEHKRTTPAVLECVAEVLEADEVTMVSFPDLDDECMFSGCENTNIDERGPVILRSGYRARACSEHWNAISVIAG